MSFAEDESILDLIRPPDGYRFSQGVWVTHDLCTGALVDLVLPALAGIGVAERRVRRSAPSALLGAHLVVIAAADRITYRAMPPNALVTTVGVPGRRLHAKFLVLQYDRLEDSPKLKGATAKRIWRAIVTSANLTKGGLTRNREVWGHQDTRSTAGAAKSLSRDLVPLARSLLVGLAKTLTLPMARAMVDLIEVELPAGTSKSGRVAHSLGSVPRAGLLSGTGLTASAARRVGIVTPAFATESSTGAVEPFGRMIDRAQVDLFVATDLTSREIKAGAAVAFSNSVVEQIRVRAHTVHVWAVPVDELADDGTPVRRPLHAKAILIVDQSNTLHVLAGSANLTTRGMTGSNRELFVHDVVPGDGSAAFNIAVKPLNAIRLPDEKLALVPPKIVDDLPLMVSVPLGIGAFFTPRMGSNAGMGRIPGELYLSGNLTGVTGVRCGVVGSYSEWPLKVEEFQDVTLNTDQPGLQVCVQNSWRDVAVTITTDLDDEFWAAEAIERTESRQLPDSLRRLFGDLAESVRNERTNANKPRGAQIVGKFTIPYERRLPSLAQAIPYLGSKGWSRRVLDDLLVDYFVEGSPELDVAAVLVNGIFGARYQGESDLLTSLDMHMHMQLSPALVEQA